MAIVTYLNLYLLIAVLRLAACPIREGNYEIFLARTPRHVSLKVRSLARQSFRAFHGFGGSQIIIAWTGPS